ncbi:hypothetical protein [Corynebacterium efficiens YS-314]|uniref:Uncharacterized protein n=1 Tax=Corynebacterium efficiens (strain DSM 44549 / YS-314 / AJ 12310 / JCM 11189 / NBRC 100395) TaxID=196164 RepID=Q8FTS4_COREF|nr:hypothetical protein [Corynebacterium efficiens YS-314]
MPVAQAPFETPTVITVCAAVVRVVSGGGRRGIRVHPTRQFLCHVGGCLSWSMELFEGDLS